jgi:hypothetical protein
MSKTITFKPEFEKKLKELKIKTKFVHHIKLYRTRLDTFEERIEALKDESTFNGFVFSAFDFSATPDGIKYWHEISQM